MADKARLEAYTAAKRIFEGAYSNLVFTNTSLSGTDLAFAKRIALGVTERRLTLMYAISLCAERVPSQEIGILLMCGAYQIIYMTRVPDSAAVNETVTLASELFGKNITGFVNAVLRRISREKEQLLKKIASCDGHIRYSVGEKLYELIGSYYGDERDRIFEAFLEKKDCFLRVNTLSASPSEVAEMTGGSVISDSAVRCADSAKALEAIGSGKYFIQGLASQKTVKLLDAKSGCTVIDVCASPGGKSLGAALDMKNKGRVIALDLHGNKLGLIEKSASLLGIDIIETGVRDAKNPDRALFGKGDRVLCDVPCSGTGEMGNKPEIKYKDPDDFTGLYATQRAILRASCEYTSIGGKLIYSTCSINKKENEEAVRYFLSLPCGKRFSLVAENTCLPTGETGEGFYNAELIRNE